MAQYFVVYGKEPLSWRQKVWAALRGQLFSTFVPGESVREVEKLVSVEDGAWVNLASREGWDKASATRGPDNGHPWEALKRVFTERIRYLLLKDAPKIVHSYPVRSVQLCSAEAAGFLSAMRVINVPENSVPLSHFLAHAREAARALGADQLADLAEAYRPRPATNTSGLYMQGPGFDVAGIIKMAGGEPPAFGEDVDRNAQA